MWKFSPTIFPVRLSQSAETWLTSFRPRFEQIDGVHSAIVTANGSRVDVVVHSVLDDLDPVREAARKKTDEVLKMLAPVGIARSRVRIKHIS